MKLNYWQGILGVECNLCVRNGEAAMKKNILIIISVAIQLNTNTTIFYDQEYWVAGFCTNCNRFLLGYGYELTTASGMQPKIVEEGLSVTGKSSSHLTC